MQLFIKSISVNSITLISNFHKHWPTLLPINDKHRPWSLLRCKDFLSVHYFLQCKESSNADKNTTFPLVIDNPPRKQSLWIPPKSNSNEMKDLYPWLKRTFFRTLVEKESYRIYSKLKRKRWKIKGRGLWYWFLLGSPDIALGFLFQRL